MKDMNKIIINVSVLLITSIFLITLFEISFPEDYYFDRMFDDVLENQNNESLLFHWDDVLRIVPKDNQSVLTVPSGEPKDTFGSYIHDPDKNSTVMLTGEQLISKRLSKSILDPQNNILYHDFNAFSDKDFRKQTVLILGDSVPAQYSQHIENKDRYKVEHVGTGGYSISQLLFSYHHYVNTVYTPDIMIYSITQNDLSRVYFRYFDQVPYFISGVKPLWLDWLPHPLSHIKLFRSINYIAINILYKDNPELFGCDLREFHSLFKKTLKFNEINGVKTILVNIPYHDEDFSTDKCMDEFLRDFVSNPQVKYYDLKPLLSKYDHREMYSHPDDYMHFSGPYNRLIARQINAIIDKEIDLQG